MTVQIDVRKTWSMVYNNTLISTVGEKYPLTDIPENLNDWLTSILGKDEPTYVELTVYIKDFTFEECETFFSKVNEELSDICSLWILLHEAYIYEGIIISLKAKSLFDIVG